MSGSPKHVRLVIEEDNLSEGALKILETVRPKWSKGNITFKLFTDGYTNKLMGCSHADSTEDVVLVRVYGENTELLIDRKAETRNMRTLHEFGYAPRLYATFSNGLAYEYLPGEVVTVDTCASVDVYPLIADMMAKVHKVNCGPNVPKTAQLWEKIRHFLDLVPSSYDDDDLQRRFKEMIPTREKIEGELSLLESKLKDADSPVVFCHNDLLLANIIYNKTENSIKFIDFEYAGYNYQAYDIGNHFAEFAGMAEVDFTRFPSKEFQLRWLKYYLESYTESGETTDQDVQRLYVQVNQFSLVTHLFWGVWALVQAKHSPIDFDFLAFSSIRLKEYFLRRDEFLALTE